MLRAVLRTGVPEFLKVHVLRCTTFWFCAQESQKKYILFRFSMFCSAHRSPIIPEISLVEISDVKQSPQYIKENHIAEQPDNDSNQ